MRAFRSGGLWKWLLGVLLAGTVAVGILLAFRPDLRYLIKTVLVPTRASIALVPVEEGTLTLEPVTLQALERDQRVTCNQSMMLINEDHPLPEDFVPQTDCYQDTDVVFNCCAMEAYAALAETVHSRFDVPLLVKSAYRTAAEQAEEQEEEGENAAQTGASEHQAGLALDVYVPGFGGRSFLKTEAGQFVNSDCWQYGFILRYPWYGRPQTGIPYEPWHLRYVGAPHAELIMGNQMTLESYLAGLEVGTIYRCGDYWVTRQDPDALRVPVQFSSAVLSPDNTGYVLLTLR